MDIQNVVVVAHHSIGRKLRECDRRNICTGVGCCRIVVHVACNAVRQEYGLGMSEGAFYLHTGLVYGHM